MTKDTHNGYVSHPGRGRHYAGRFPPRRKRDPIPRNVGALIVFGIVIGILLGFALGYAVSQIAGIVDELEPPKRVANHATHTTHTSTPENYK